MSSEEHDDSDKRENFDGSWPDWTSMLKGEASVEYAKHLDEQNYGFGDEAVEHVYGIARDELGRDLTTRETYRMLNEMDAGISPYKVVEKLDTWQRLND